MYPAERPADGELMGGMGGWEVKGAEAEAEAAAEAEIWVV